MSVRQTAPAAPSPGGEIAAITEKVNSVDTTLGEGSSYAVASPDHPLRRTVVVSIKSSLNELCLQKTRGTWAPSADALRSIFQQKKFTSLEGTAEPQGDLKAIVLHSMNLTSVSSNFPCALGTRITGVDDCTFSSTGEAFSTIILPKANSTAARELQADDVSLAYEFAGKFPGYTADNLAEKGVHEVSQRRFVLVAADHPIVSAIQENADKLQMGEISGPCQDWPAPLVKTQVESQIKVRDFSKTTVSIQPAEYPSWSDARSDMMVEAKRAHKAKLVSEMSAAADEAESSAIRARYEKEEKAIEHDIDHAPLNVNLTLDLSYNFLSR